MSTNSTDNTPPALLSELRAAGIDVATVWDLVNSTDTPAEAEPVLVEWLADLEERVPRQDWASVREGLVRALTAAKNKRVVVPLMVELIWRVKDAEEPLVPWAIGNAIGELASRQDLDALRRICANPELGMSRQMVVRALGRLKDVQSVPLLVELLRDPEIGAHAAHALGKVGGASVIPHLERLSSDLSRTAFVRQEAQHAKRRILNQSGLTP